MMRQMGMEVCALWKKALISASAADETTCFMVFHSTWRGPFLLRESFLSVSWKNLAMRLRALGRTKYEASESTLSIMLLEW